MKRLVLASASPRRREFLAMLGVPFEVLVPPGQESLPGPGEAPEAVVGRLALEKARRSVAHRSVEEAGDALVLGADTLVALDGELLGKPNSQDQAVEMLERLKGRRHQVLTGLALVEGSTGRVWTGYQRTTVVMRSYGREEILRYVASGEPMDKAGAYAIQDRVFAPSERVERCYWNVVGLPLCLAARLLREGGLALQVKVREIGARCHDCLLVTQEEG